MRVAVATLMALAVAGVQASSAPPPGDPVQWVQAYWAAYQARDVDAIRALFSPTAFVGRAPAERYFESLRNELQRRQEIRIEPLENPRVRQAQSGFSVTQKAAIHFRSTENGLLYRETTIRDWFLIREGSVLLATSMNILYSTDPGLKVGDVRLTTRDRGPDGRPAQIRTQFVRGQHICFLASSDEVQGGHVFRIRLRSPRGRTEVLPGVFGLGPIEKPGPLSVWWCVRIPENADEGEWTATVEVDGTPKSGITFNVLPETWVPR